ncbi:MAG TPA: RNA-binding protein [Candidatus Eisenbacteria bacterium]|jgi:RNA recognition motif-containing protein|nr:RNA-binding protein [Candidatus Eisenbacteria bacterium]
MQKKLYIGNLSFNASQDDLQGLFSQYGSIDEVSIITDRQTGRPKGFAFVRFASEDDAQRALEQNGRDFMGRPLQVTEARSEGPYPSGSGGGGYGSRRPEARGGHGSYGTQGASGVNRNW